jgi:hypothetical protein
MTPVRTFLAISLILSMTIAARAIAQSDGGSRLDLESNEAVRIELDAQRLIRATGVRPGSGEASRIEDEAHERAHAAGVPPDDVLAAIIQHDFDGVGWFRNGWVLYTDGKSPVVGDCGCSVSREAFTEEYDSLVIASNLKMIGVRGTKGKDTLVAARFTVVGSARHIDNKPARLTAAKSVHDETVTYRLRVKNGAWYLVDPPLPRLGIDALDKAVQRDLNLEEELMTKALAKPDEPRLIRDRRQSLDLAKEQMAQLEPILKAAHKP